MSKKTTTKRPPRTKPMLPPPMETQNAPVVTDKRTVDDAVIEVVTRIDVDHYASDKVSRKDSIEFYEQIRNACNERIEQLQEELGQENK